MNFIKKLTKYLSVSNKLVLYFLITFFAFSFLLYNIIPILLNYPPDTINTQFDKEVSMVYYKYQFLSVIVGISLFFTIYLKISLKNIDKWMKNRKSNLQKILDIRKKALTFPFKLYICMEIFPTLILLLVLSLTGSHPAILMFKLGSILFSFSTLIASFFLVLSKKVLYPVLVETSKYIYMDEKAKSFSLKFKLFFQLFPGVLVVALIISLLGYYRLTVEKANILNTYYHTTLSSECKNINTNNINEIEKHLSNYYLDNNVFSFIENPDGSIQTSNGSNLSHFFVKYMHDLSDTHNNTVYETYTVDSQAVIEKANINRSKLYYWYLL